ncbi:MAG: nicotinate-nucleotide--dimethylbenzimidazole phosphoribosyltransferase [bacterium]|nr:nicotinate-nucleotide--dimethylbenzimidazole phosphoribosyltransferase [bacterium]
MGSAFPEAERAGLYRAILERRDIRSYRPDLVPDDVLARILRAAHQAGSVGFMQPWNFGLIRDPDVKRAMHAHFLEVNDRAASPYDGDRQQRYRSLKLQGLLDAPLHVLVTCDPDRGGPHVLGRATMRETDVYSTCLAVQNLWLAARAEGVGVGWMSLMEPDFVRKLLGIPESVILVAYLTVGYPVEFPTEPMLEVLGWRQRQDLESLVWTDRWERSLADHDAPLNEALARTDLAQEVEAERPRPPDVPLPPVSVPPESGEDVVTVVRERLGAQTRPRGSLGRLEELAARLATTQRRPYPSVARRGLWLLAGDHGVAAHGVSAYHARATHQMVYQFLAGHGTVNALARQARVPLEVADLGVAHDFGDATGLHHCKVRPGTRPMHLEDAMTPLEVERALAHGRDLFTRGVRRWTGGDDLDLLLLGEMGIGNSTAAAALVTGLLEGPVHDWVGRGTGIGDEALARKRDLVTRALSRRPGLAADPLGALAAWGGYELAGLVGLLLEAHARRVPVLLDGFIVGAAALVASRLQPGIEAGWIASHVSAEPAHRAVLSALRLEPLLDWGLRLGEGSGAVLALGALEAACSLVSEVRTYPEAGLDEPVDPSGRC